MSPDIKSQHPSSLCGLKEFSLSTKKTCFSSSPPTFSISKPEASWFSFFKFHFLWNLSIHRTREAVNYSSGQLWPTLENGQLLVNHLLQEISQQRKMEKCMQFDLDMVRADLIALRSWLPQALLLSTGRSRKTGYAVSEGHLLYWRVGRVWLQQAQSIHMHISNKSGCLFCH